METYTNNMKRKKRKSRKCLDELRKRSRRTTNIPISKEAETLFTKYETSNATAVHVNNNYITSGRLTLKMFPKAVCSETITRPYLIDIKNRANVNIVKGKKNACCTVTSNSFDGLPHLIDNGTQVQIGFKSNHENNKQNNTNTLQCSATEVNNENHINSDVLSDQHNDSGSSIMLFSPVNQMENSDFNANEITSTPSSSSITQNSNDFEYQLYKELMDELPSYLRKNAPSLTTDDFVKKIKAQLFRIQTQNMSHANSIVQGTDRKWLQNKRYCMSIQPNRQTIVQNPMEYIKIGQQWQDQVFNISETTDSSSPAISPHSPVAPYSPLGTCKLPTHTIIIDTPEYTYYPHKLNQ